MKRSPFFPAFVDARIVTAKRRVHEAGQSHRTPARVPKEA
jgi:hypothetical protein